MHVYAYAAGGYGAWGVVCVRIHVNITYFLLLGVSYVYCVLNNVLNHLHRCEECYIQLVVDD